MSDPSLPERWTRVGLPQAVVAELWGFVEASQRAEGVKALFIGPSGSGQAMAAELVGEELNRDPYRIDLSQVVSKYIGETEKNLRRLIDEAEPEGAILFIDEADPLFTTRTEVKDAHDRYANLETNYVMELLEKYSGPVIVAVNRREILDRQVEGWFDHTIVFPADDPED